MKLSVILATANRASVIAETFDSIAAIKCDRYNTIQVVVIDQSFNDETYNLLLKYKGKFEYIYIHSLKKGLSLSRNIGLDIIDGDVYCFGDDDCVYESDILNKLSVLFNDDALTFVCSGVYIPDTNLLSTYTKHKTSVSLSLQNILGRVTSISIFIKNNKNMKAIRFNENLGLGAFYGSCEEIDFIYRLIELGGVGMYEPLIKVFHANPNGYNQNKTYNYALGHGAFARILLSKATFLSFYQAFVKITKSFLKFPAAMFVNKKLHPKSYFLGFWTGFIKW